MHTSEDGKSRALHLRSIRCQDEVAEEQNWIRHAIEHKCRERVSSNQWDISASLNHSVVAGGYAVFFLSLP
jgi:hypothetical protein